MRAAREWLLQQLTAHGRLALDATCQQLLLRMSSPALQRYLRTLPGRRLVPRRPRRERSLRARVPLRVLQPKPCAAGTFECDLIEHNGGHSGGEYIYTMHMVDVVMAWRCTWACMGNHRRRIMAHLQQMLQDLPYTAQVLDTDTGTAFMNDTVVPQLERHGIRVTRSRACKKNDNAHVEQKKAPTYAGRLAAGGMTRRRSARG